MVKGDSVRVVHPREKIDQRFLGKIGKIARVITDEPEHGIRYNLSFPKVGFWNVVFYEDEIEKVV